MRLEFGDAQLDVGRFELRRAGQPIKLEPKVFDVLRYLVQHRERVVPREELLATLWPDEHVIDAVVTRCVYEIRRVLARTDSDPIETVRGRGYRFAEPVRVIDAEAAPDRVEPFVGREREIRRLEATLARATQGQGRFALLVGEPGVGKTRITEELAARVRASGDAVWVSRCHEDQGAPPFWLWTQVARRCVRQLQDDDVRQELGGAYRELAALLPELTDEREAGEPSAALHADAAHYRLFDAVTRLLRLATAHGRHLLVLDDLHWADLPSLQLMGFVIAEIADRPLFILGTCRDTDWAPDDPRKAVIDGFSRHANFERVPVVRLSADAVSEYVTQRVGEQRPGLAQALHRISEGNAFFMVEALRPALLGPAPAGARASLALPDASRDIVRRRLAVLDDEGRVLLQTAAVFGMDFDVGLLADVAESDSMRTLEALQPSLQACLILAVQENAGRFRFAHGLIRETLYAEVPIARRAQLHAAIATRMERLRPPPASEIAHHFHRSLPVGDAARALHWTRAAGEAASLVYAHDAAVKHHRQALDALRALPEIDASVHQEILRLLGGALYLSGRIEPARATFREAAGLARQAGDHRGFALAIIGLRDCQALRAVPDPSVDAELRDALDRLPSSESSLRARVLSRLAAVRSMETRRQASRSAAELARDIEDPTVLADVWSARLHALQGPHEIEQRLEVADRLIALSDAQRQAAWAWEALLARYDGRLRLGDVARADEALAACGALAERLHHPGMRLGHARLSAQRAICEGRYADAEQQILRNAEIAQRLSDPFGQFYFLVQMFWLLRDRGLIHTLGDQAEQFIRARPWVEPTARSTAALMYIEQGDREGARRSFDYYARDDFEGVPYGEDFVSVFAQLTVVCAGLGATEHAARIYDVLLPHAGQNVVNGTSTSFGSTAHFLGVLARLLGRVDAAREHFERALAMNEAMRLRPALVRTQLAYADLFSVEAPKHAAELRQSAASMAQSIEMTLPAAP